MIRVMNLWFGHWIFKYQALAYKNDESMVIVCLAGSLQEFRHVILPTLKLL